MTVRRHKFTLSLLRRAVQLNTQGGDPHTVTFTTTLHSHVHYKEIQARTCSGPLFSSVKPYSHTMSGDRTPCRMTGVTLHGVGSPECSGPLRGGTLLPRGGSVREAVAPTVAVLGLYRGTSPIGKRPRLQDFSGTDLSWPEASPPERQWLQRVPSPQTPASGSRLSGVHCTLGNRPRVKSLRSSYTGFYLQTSCASKASLKRTGVHCTCGLVSPCSGRDCKVTPVILNGVLSPEPWGQSPGVGHVV